MAYLARRRDTNRLRILLLPVVIASLVSWPYKHTWVFSLEYQELIVLDWGVSLLVCALIAKTLQFALDPNGALKVGEEQLPPSALFQGSRHREEEAQREIRREHLPWVPSGLYDALEVAVSQRGIGFTFGAGTYLPPHTKPLSRGPFLLATFLSLLHKLLVIDVLENTLRHSVPGLMQGGRTIFVPTLPPPFPQQYVPPSILITVLSGWHMFTGFMAIYDLATLFCVSILHSSPSSWPPALQSPFKSDSLHKFWARSWHQLLRQSFLIYGGYPGLWLAGPAGMGAGVFLASGLVHECSVYMVDAERGWEWWPVGFFMLQSAGLIGEKAFTGMSGRRVGGWAGRVWGYAWVLGTVQFVFDSWYRRGLRGGLVITVPPRFSPVHYLIQRYFGS
ncbi:hypothetical protein BDV98DRAFT_589967 [Pterulicium gracile]|uniref:Wax synthase domain-containing protein n=1 Tax=Pterulicium gracile TaxID=1884261 RepID=A0A5C3QXJ4_9AGAR|nr:hypothetical protein BDV98DRAFT_589967 [Pterula gracilis]